MTLKPIIAVTFAICSLGVQGAGIQADHIVTHIEQDRERVEVGQWIQDEFGRTRINVDDWTQIQDPIEGIVWRANSKRGRYSESRRRLPTVPMGSPLIDIPGSLSSENSREISRTDLGTRVINGVECKGTMVEIVVSGRGFNKKYELEAWLTEAFIFPFNVLFIVRDDNGEQRTELQNILERTDRQLEGVFKPDRDWRKSRFPIVRANKVWTGFWPLTKPGSRVTGMPFPWPVSRQREDDSSDAHIRPSR